MGNKVIYLSILGNTSLRIKTGISNFSTLWKGLANKRKKIDKIIRRVIIQSIIYSQPVRESREIRKV